MKKGPENTPTPTIINPPVSVSVNQAITETVGTCSFNASTDPTANLGFEYRIIFGEAIDSSTFDVTDITNSGTGGGTVLVWSLINCGDDTNFQLTATSVVGDGTIVPVIVAGAVQTGDSKNNSASTSTDNSILFDVFDPEVTINQAVTEVVGDCRFTATLDPTGTIGFNYRITFSEAINPETFHVTDIINSGTGGGTTLDWSLGNCGDNRNFKLTTTAITGYGTIRPFIAANKLQDFAGKNNIASTSTDNSVDFIFTGWYQEAYVKAANSGLNDNFGVSVSLSGDTLAVGSTGEDSNQTTITNGITASLDNSSIDSGAVYVYKRTGVNWQQEAYIKAANNEVYDSFGMNVSLSGDLLAVGAPFEDSNQTTITNGASASSDNSSVNSGAVYLYKRTGANWQQEAYIKASNSGFLDTFGKSISLSGDTLAVGSSGEDGNQTTIINGATVVDNDLSVDSGAVYVYKRVGASWQQEAYIKGPNSEAFDNFGVNVSLNKETLAVGATGEDSNQSTITNGLAANWDNSNSNSGAVYVYKRVGATWFQEAYIKAANNDASDNFGVNVSLSGDFLAVGASGEDSDQTTITNGASASSNNLNGSSGAVYIYKRSGVAWQQEAYIKAANNDSSDIFGSNVSLSGDTLAVGAIWEDSNQTTITNGTTASANNSSGASGAVYVYRRTGMSWRQEAYIKAVNSDVSDTFGSSVSLSGDTLAVGANWEDSNQTTITNGTTASANNSSGASGAVYVYRSSARLFDPPTFIASAKTTNTLTISWGGVGQLTRGYKIAYSAGLVPPANCNSGTVIDVGNVLTYTVTSLSMGTNYSFRICSYDAIGTLSQGETAIFATASNTPEVQSLVATPNSESAITLSWANSGGGTTGFKVAYRLGVVPPEDCSSGTVFNARAVTSFQITGLNVNRYYGFRVCSYDALSNFSLGYPIVAKTNSTPEVTGLNISSASLSVATVSWLASGGLTNGYRLSWSLGGVAPFDCYSGNQVNVGPSTSYNIVGLNRGDQISVRVCSYKTSGADISAGVTIKGSTLDLGWSQEAYIKAANNDSFDRFGGSVSLSENTLAVGARYEDSNQTTITNGTMASADNSSLNSGAVYVYKRIGVNWQQEAYIKAVNNTNDQDAFGIVVSISGNTLAVGARNEASDQTTITNGTTASANNSLSSSGAVYVYKRTGVTWQQEAYIKASNRDPFDYFGTSLFLSGETLAVGAVEEDSNQTTITNGTTASEDDSSSNSGALYVYRRTGVIWLQEAYIKTDNNGSNDSFGYSISLSGDTLAVGATGEDSNQTTITNGTTASADNSNSNSGAVYVYRRTGANWQQEAYIKSDNNDPNDSFGYSISLSGDTLAVGAIGEDSNQTMITNGTTASADNSNSNSGAVYVYRRTGANWQQEAYVKAVNGDSADQFGSSVSLNGNSLAVGAIEEDSNQTTITNGTTASANNSNSNSGAVYVYKRTGANWQQEAYIKPINNGVADQFGQAISLSGDTLAVGSEREGSNQTTITNGTTASSNDLNTFSGAVYIYRNNARLLEVHEVFGASDSTSVTLSWHKSGGTATEYLYSYQLGATAPVDCLSGTTESPGNVMSDVVAGLISATTYSFRVCAFDGSNMTEGRTFTISTLP